jgi:6-phosphogluconolactonase
MGLNFNNIYSFRFVNVSNFGLSFKNIKMKNYTWLQITTVLLTACLFVNMSCTEKEKIISKEQNKSVKSVKADTSSIQAANKTNNDSLDSDRQLLLFVGTYTTAIYVYKMDTATGALSKVCSSPSTNSPSYLAIHPNKKWFYSVNEYIGTISAFGFDSVKNQITFFNSVSSKGDGPCYVSIDKTGKYVMTANYNSGSVAVFPINADGSIGEASGFDQHSGAAPHAHMIVQADNNFVYNTDLGLDKIFIYNLDTTTGKIQDAGIDANTVTGAGPRHIAFHPNHLWAYVVCELGGIVEAFNIDNTSGALTFVQSASTLPSGSTETPGSADIHITPDGKYLYASNRGTVNNIAMFSISQDSGKLSLIGNQAANGNTPRSFIIDPSGKFLLVANQDGNNIVTFKIDYSTGKLIGTGIQTSLTSPVCLKFLITHKIKTATGIQTINLK